MNKEFGYFGDDLEGYIHYKQAFDANFVQDTVDAASCYDTACFDEENNICNDGLSEEDACNNCMEGFTLSFRQPVTAAELICKDIAAVTPGEDLSQRYKLNTDAYDYRRALLEYFSEIRESYQNSTEIEYEDILAQVLLVDFDYGYQVWRWMVEHFQHCLAGKLSSWKLCVTVLYEMSSDLQLSMAKRLGEDEEMLQWIFSKCFDFSSGQADLLSACLEAGYTPLFEKLLSRYMVRKDWLSDGSLHFDAVIENCLRFAYVSNENYEALQKYIAMLPLGLRRKFLEKRLQDSKSAE